MREKHWYTFSQLSVSVVLLGGSSFKSIGDNMFYRLWVFLKKKKKAMTNKVVKKKTNKKKPTKKTKNEK